MRVSRVCLKVPDTVRHAALESIFGPILDNPNRLGKPLVGELEGLWSVRGGDYRIIYEIFEDDQAVLIHRVHTAERVPTALTAANRTTARASCAKRRETMQYGERC